MTRTDHVTSTLLLSTFLCALSLGPALADGDGAEKADELRVAIVVLTAVNLSRDEADIIADRLGQALIEKHLLSVRAGALLRASLDGPVPETCLKQKLCIVELGRKLGVEHILFLNLVQVGKLVRLSATPANARTGDANARIRIRLGSEEDQKRVFADSVTRLLPMARERPAKVEPKHGDPKENGNPNGGNGENGQGGHDLVNGGNKPGDRVGKPRRLTTPVLVVGGIGVASLLSGAAFGLWATSLHGQLDDKCPGPECGGALDDTRLRINIADASFAVAIIAGATASALYYFSGESAPKAVTPVVTPTSVGVSLHGRF